MNTKENMIFVKGEIKTSTIKSCYYNSETKKWDITYNNGKSYSYAYPNVEWLKDPVPHNPNIYRISRNNKEFFNLQGISVFNRNFECYWHICFENGVERDYPESELTIEKSCLDNKQAENVFCYLKQLSTLSEIRNPDTGEKILAKRYEQIKFISRNTALSKYIETQEETGRQSKDLTSRNVISQEAVSQKVIPLEFIPVFPFGCNNSQYKAVKAAMENRISVIQGPPGTGKTQTILNIIANILMQGKTVQVVSNNNAAIDNVYEKLASQEYGLEFIAAQLGNSQNKKAFIENQSPNYTDFSSSRMDSDSPVTLKSIQAQSLKLKKVFDQQERQAKLQQELAALDLEFQYFRQYLDGTDVSASKTAWKTDIKSAELMELWQRCQEIADENRKPGLLFKVLGFFKYGIFGRDFYKQGIAEIITTFQKAFYERRRKELCEELSDIAAFLEKSDKCLMQKLCDESMKLLKSKLAERYSPGGSRPQFSENDLWNNPQAVLAEYPVILSTTFSSRSSLNSDTVYDYLIMDEASQVDVATGALALSCARNAVIVGDTRQLPNVVSEDMRQKADAVFDSFHLKEGYRYTNSFLQSVIDVIPHVTQTLLREHYRCHPKIIHFCNQKFYRGDLIIMTKDRGEKDVLTVVKTVVGNHARGHRSQRQIDIIKKEILPQYVTDRNGTGIIAPYKDQVKALEREFTDMDVATVHKFQGREKDTIIISTVDDELTDFVDDPYLLNVAISRAKKKLMLVVSGNEQSPDRNISDLIAYIQYNNFEVTESKIYSIFDYLYKQYTVARQEYLKSRKRISVYDSENLMYGLICDVLQMNEFASLEVVCHFPMNMLIRNPELLDGEDCKYAMHPGTHIDFLVFNRISKLPILAIEVDGDAFHRKDSLQGTRDARKDRILKRYGIACKRFRTDGSGEKEELIKELKLRRDLPSAWKI